MAHIKKRGKKWYIYYRIDGKLVGKSLQTTDYREARRKKRELEAELIRKRSKEVDPWGDLPVAAVNGTITSLQNAIGQQIAALPKNAPVEDFWPRYVEWARRHKRTNTLSLHQTAWKKLTGFAAPERLADITPHVLEDFKVQMLDDGLTPRSVNCYFEALQGIFSQAIKQEYFSGPNPAAVIERLRQVKNPPRYLSKTQVEKLLEEAKKKGRDIHLFIALGIYAGLRKNEIGHSRWEWVDFENRLITLSNHEGFTLKDYETRTIPLSSKLAEILEPCSEPSGFLFAAERTTPGDSRYRFDPKRSFSKVVEEAKVPWCTPHTLRHTFASQLAIAGKSIYKISKWLGHANVRTTQVYAHLQSQDDDINGF